MSDMHYKQKGKIFSGPHNAHFKGGLDNRIIVYVTLEEKERIRRAAKEEKKTMSNFIVCRTITSME